MQEMSDAQVMTTKPQSTRLWLIPTTTGWLHEFDTPYAGSNGIQYVRADLAVPTSAAPVVDDIDLDRLASEVVEVCVSRGWSLHWTHRGAYLHLESSELVEAVRGKRGSVKHEAADVLLVLMSITENCGIRFGDVVRQARTTVETLRVKPHYAGEEYATEIPAQGGQE